MNSFGRLFRVSIFGESHGPAVGCILDGCPPGLELAEGDFDADMARRRSGAIGTTPRREADRVELLSGLHGGRTTGAPLTLLVRNTDTRSSDYDLFVRRPRPGHADYTARMKFAGFSDPRGGGHFSGRITAALVAAGVIAKKTLLGITFATRILELGGFPADGSGDPERAVARAADELDSIGGIVECRIRSLPPGLGEPFFDSAESVISHALFAVPAVRGVEFGDGFASSRQRGSEHNDPIVDASGTTATNHSGGINGGITNGNELVVRIAVKPTSSIGKPQTTFDFVSGTMETLLVGGRHDSCIALRIPVVAEAACAIACADLFRIFTACGKDTP